MKRSILLVGADTILGSALRERLDGEQVPLAWTVAAQTPTSGEARAIPWQRSSSLSARNVVAQAERLLGVFDTVFLPYSPWSDGADLSEMAVFRVDQVLDDWLRGFLYLLRELLARARDRALEVNFVFLEEGVGFEKPLQALAYHGMLAFAQALLHSAPKAWTIRIFQASGCEPHVLLGYVLERLAKPTPAGHYLYPDGLWGRLTSLLSFPRRSS